MEGRARRSTDDRALTDDPLIRLHLLVPGGKWPTVSVNPVRSAKCWSSHFPSRILAPLLPPQSAVMSSEVARGEEGLAHDLPPPSDRAHRELRRVVVDPYTHPPLVTVQVVHPVGDCLSPLGSEEVVDPNRLGLAPGPPLASPVLEVPNQLLLP